MKLNTNSNTNPDSTLLQYDIFLSHNSSDKAQIEEIACWLRDQGIRVWFDKWNLVPGLRWQDIIEEGIVKSRAIAVFIGPSGFAQWEIPEMRAALDLYVQRKSPVIPIFLPGCPENPDIPLFLQAYTRIDFRRGLDDQEARGKLLWAITGKNPYERPDESDIHPEDTASRKFFISYSHDDPDEKRLAHFLHSEFTLSGHESFIDIGIKAGMDWVKEISHYINWCDCLVVLLSESSMESEMVQEEIRMVHQRQQETGDPKIIPIRIRYFGPLDYELEICLGHLQFIKWENSQDSKRVLKEILASLDIAVKRREPADWVREDQQPKPVTDIRRPQSAIDPRAAYVPGGTLRHDDPYYIRRSADDLVEELAQRTGETLVIKAPRQIGKSSLLLHYLAKCQQTGKSIVFIDFSIFSQKDFVTYSGFLSKITRVLVRALRINRTEEPKFESQTEMTWFIEDNILPINNTPLVIAFDETDRVLGKEYQADFFTMLRLWHNNRANIALAWEKVDLALVISTEPYLLIEESDRSPFNVAPPIELKPFSLEQCQELNERYENLLSETQVSQLWELLQGHPYLTRLAYYRMCGREKTDLSTLLTTSADDRGPFGNHLRTLLAKLHAHPDLLRAMQETIRKGTIPNDDLYYRLYGAGLVKREGDRTNPANLLYARYFKRAI